MLSRNEAMIDVSSRDTENALDEDDPGGWKVESSQSLRHIGSAERKPIKD